MPKGFRKLIFLKPPSLGDVRFKKNRNKVKPTTFEKELSKILEYEDSDLLEKLIDSRLEYFRTYKIFYNSTLKKGRSKPFSPEGLIWKVYLQKRKDLWKAKELSDDEIRMRVFDRHWHNFAPPEWALIHCEENEMDFLPNAIIPPNDDLVRTYLTYLECPRVRKTLRPTGSLLRLAISQPLEIYDHEIYARALRDFKSLSAFGDPYTIEEYIMSAYGSKTRVAPHELPDLFDLSKIAIGKGSHVYCIDGILINVNPISYEYSFESGEFVYDKLISSAKLSIPEPFTWVDFARMFHTHYGTDYNKFKYLRDFTEPEEEEETFLEKMPLGNYSTMFNKGELQRFMMDTITMEPTSIPAVHAEEEKKVIEFKEIQPPESQEEIDRSLRQLDTRIYIRTPGMDDYTASIMVADELELSDEEGFGFPDQSDNSQNENFDDNDSDHGQ